MWRFDSRTAAPQPQPQPQTYPPPGTGSPPLDYCARRYAGLPTSPVPDLGPQTVAAVWTLVVLSTVFLAVRVYCKVWRLKGLWWDDWVLILSWVCEIGNASIVQTVVNLGFGKYPCDIDIANLPSIGLIGPQFGGTVNLIAITLSKTAFAITLLRLTEGGLNRFIWFLLVSMNLITAANIFILWFKCAPIAKSWSPFMEGTCISSDATNGFGVFWGVYSGVCDIVLAFVPWRLVWNLQMHTREKLGVAIAMSIGVFAGATAFVKSATILTLGKESFTYDGTGLLTWSAAEIGTTIMACCIPVMRVLFREINEKRNRRHQHSTRSYSPTSKQRRMAAASGDQSTAVASSTTSPSLGKALWGMWANSRDEKLAAAAQNNNSNSTSPPPSTSDVKSAASPNKDKIRLFPAVAVSHRERAGASINNNPFEPRAASRGAGGIMHTQEFTIEYHHHHHVDHAADADADAGHCPSDQQSSGPSSMYEMSAMERRGEV
ncbi:hypothetical protein B0T26DRAFT_752753 [Lasiosphaeria miniovina]|uniref:Rhodopsin domain-containing protein n=1 Tax=Lasiosphaeria miniovina TaxID=1954250 RepID=A0AA40AAZ7_9PEZI|nr:uncharacterized protein B0T26DRAFT_752753 [Lasiosphaeria miniovina]KAK0712526.1 hypothetical protein B0T26DRAFT_752753 [Lasiosphaeria miniovina]